MSWEHWPTLRMQVLQREDEVRRVEACDVRREATRATEMGEELAALHVLHQEVQVPLVVESAEAGPVSVVPRARKTCRLTIKGCETFARVLRSELRCST